MYRSYPIGDRNGVTSPPPPCVPYNTFASGPPVLTKRTARSHHAAALNRIQELYTQGMLTQNPRSRYFFCIRCLRCMQDVFVLAHVARHRTRTKSPQINETATCGDPTSTRCRVHWKTSCSRSEAEDRATPGSPALCVHCLLQRSTLSPHLFRPQRHQCPRPQNALCLGTV